MSSLITWCYCEKCGKKIMVGDTCFDIGIDTYCSDCCKEVNTLYEYERRCETGENDNGLDQR